VRKRMEYLRCACTEVWGLSGHATNVSTFIDMSRTGISASRGAGSAARRRNWRRQIVREPPAREIRDDIQRAAFLEQVSRARDDLEPYDATHVCHRRAVEPDNLVVVPADDQ